MADFADKRVGVVAGSLSERRLKAANVPADPVTRDEQNLAKLDAGRIDYWLTNEDFAGILAHKANRLLPKLAFALPVMGVGLACNKDLRPELLHQLQHSAASFRASHRHDWPALE